MCVSVVLHVRMLMFSSRGHLRSSPGAVSEPIRRSLSRLLAHPRLLRTCIPTNYSMLHSSNLSGRLYSFLVTLCWPQTMKTQRPYSFARSRQYAGGSLRIIMLIAMTVKCVKRHIGLHAQCPERHVRRMLLTLFAIFAAPCDDEVRV